MKFNPAGLHHPKRVIAIVTNVLVLAALITYAAFSYFYWRDYDSRGPQAAANLKTSIETRFTSDAKTTPANAIDDVIAEFEATNGSSPCQVNAFYQWEMVIPALKTMGTHCDERFFTALEVTTALKRLSTYLKDQKTIADLLLLTTKATASPKDYSAAAKAWDDVGSTNLPENEDLQPVTDKVKTVAKAISKAFTALVTADKKEDKAAFDTASADLKSAYADLKQTKTLATKSQASLIDAVILALAKLG